MFVLLSLIILSIFILYKTVVTKPVNSAFVSVDRCHIQLVNKISIFIKLVSKTEHALL